MDANAPRGLLRVFAQMKDPRVNRTKKHSLTDILTLALCAIICGADGWVQVEEFGDCKMKWFTPFLDLPNGIPSHDTFGRVFAALDPSAFEECFMKWVADLTQASAGRLIAIDGKTIRCRLDTANGKSAIDRVNAWCAANHMVLGQLATDDCHGIAYRTAATTDKGHGRIEQRRIWATTDIQWFAEKGKWKNLRSLIRVQAKRTINGQTSSEYRYCISSRPADNASRLLGYIRGHWGVENNLHGCLDINFREDDGRIRQGHAAENFARLNRIALNLLKAQTGHKVGIKTKRLCCGWSHEYLFRVLTQQDQGI